MQPQRLNSPLTLFKRTLTASSVVDGNSLINATGSKLFCKTAVQPFKVRLDNGESFDFEEGFSYEMAPGDYFKGLELVNPNPTALNVELYVGNARIFRAAPLFTRDAPTVTTGGNYTITAAGNRYLDPVYTGTGRHRKQVVINNQGSGTLHLYSTNAAHDAGSLLMWILAGEKITLFTSDYLRLFNGTGSSIVAGVTETYYT
jgi:hypothetical protein